MVSSKDKSTEQAKPAPRRRQEIQGLGDLLFSFPAALKWEIIGDSHTLKVTDAKPLAASEFDDATGLRTGVKRYGDGKPVMQLGLIGVLIESTTDVPLGGSWTMFVRGRAMRDALRKALAEAGVEGIAPGDRVTFTYTEDEPVYDNNGHELENARKLYTARVDTE